MQYPGYGGAEALCRMLRTCVLQAPLPIRHCGCDRRRAKSRARSSVRIGVARGQNRPRERSPPCRGFAGLEPRRSDPLLRQRSLGRAHRGRGTCPHSRRRPKVTRSPPPSASTRRAVIVPGKAPVRRRQDLANRAWTRDHGLFGGARKAAHFLLNSRTGGGAAFKIAHLMARTPVLESVRQRRCPTAKFLGHPAVHAVSPETEVGCFGPCGGGAQRNTGPPATARFADHRGQFATNLQHSSLCPDLLIALQSTPHCATAGTGGPPTIRGATPLLLV